MASYYMRVVLINCKGGGETTMSHLVTLICVLGPDIATLH